MIIVQDTNLKSQVWVVQSGPNVNSIPSQAFIATQLPNGTLKVSNIANVTMGGALVTCKRPVPVVPGVNLSFLKLNMQIRVASDDLVNLLRFENDVKVCVKGAPNSSTPIANVYDFSSQLNFSTGQWQIDTSPSGWVDTGFKPTLPPDTWIPVEFRYQLNSSTFSMLGTTWGTQSFNVPSTMQGLPLQVTNWQPVAAIQLQTESALGEVTTEYKGITLTWSDQQI